MKLVLCVLPVLSLLAIACTARMPANRAEIDYFDLPSTKVATAEPIDETDPEPEFVAPEGMVITTGVHGNEPSGWLVQDQLAEMGFTVFGPCNPWGIENNSRYLEDGRDLNRIFGQDAECDEVDAVKAFLAKHPPEFLLDLHEDPNGTGPYLIQHGPDDSIGRSIIDALKDRYEFDPEPQFLMVKGEDGLLKPEMKHLQAMAFLKIYGLGYYAWRTYGCTTIVVECPGSWSEDKRKQYQLDVCRTAAELFAKPK